MALPWKQRLIFQNNLILALKIVIPIINSNPVIMYCNLKYGK